MFDRACKHSSVEQFACHSAQSHTPKHETITRRQTQIDKNLSHKHRHRLHVAQERNVSPLVTVLWNKTGSQTTVTFLPTLTPHTHHHHPHSHISSAPSVLPTAPLLLPFITPPLFLLACPPLTSALTSFSHSLFCPLSDLAWFYILLPPSYPADQTKKGKKKKVSDILTCIWRSISMVAWPPETVHHGPLHSKREPGRGR